MNKREAVAVQALLDWVLALDAFEIDPEPGDLSDEELIRIIGVLADRSHTALGAGLSQGDAITAAMHLLGLVVVTPDGPDDVAPNAGSAT